MLVSSVPFRDHGDRFATQTDERFAFTSFQRLQLAGIGYIHTAKLGLVLVKGGFRDSVVPANIGRLLAALLLSQNADDLFFREP